MQIPRKKILLFLFAVLAVLLTVAFFFFSSSCATPPPVDKKRFANDAPISEFDIPKYSLDLPFDQSEALKEFIIQENFLPFAIIKYQTPLLMAKDEQNLYTTLSESQDLEKYNPEEVQKRKPYLGICAFDLKTKQLKWKIPLYANTTNFPATSKRLYVVQPYLFGDQLAVLKRDYVLNTELEIIEKKTGKLIKIESIGSEGTYSFLEDKYLLKFIYKTGFDMLNTATGKKIWTYSFRDGSFKPDSGTTGSFHLLSNNLLFFYYTYPDKFGFDILNIVSGKMEKTIEFMKSETGEAFFRLLAFDKDLFYFRVIYCGKSGFDIQAPDCEYCDIVYDNAKKEVVKRTVYKKK